jgi:hypothetical protein
MEGPMRNALILAAVVGLASPAFAQNTDPGSSAQHELRSIGYARLGYGGASADQFRSAPAIGFGYRAELESFALDVSFFNYVIRADPYETGRDVFAGSVLRLQALHFLDAEADRSAYVGAGLSWGGVSVSRGSSGGTYSNSWRGSGLQGELTAGYELTRSTPMRFFIQTDIGLPFFKAKSESYNFMRLPDGLYRPATVEERYIPSAVISLGIGWQRR